MASKNDVTMASVSRATWLAASPDARQHLATIPANWNMRRVAAIAPNVKPALLSTWTCLLGPALRESPRLQKKVKQCDPELARFVREAAHALQAEKGITPSPTQVLKRALRADLAVERGVAKG